jgi:phosphatidylglycerophosphate synthase
MCRADFLSQSAIRMADYSPTSRRPIAQAFRNTAGGAVRFCVAAGIHPDVISYLSIAASAIAAACFAYASRAPWLLIIAPLFCYLRLWFNMLDGMVALASGKASRRGEILNELPDRISDLLVFIAIAHSGFASVLLGYWAAIAALMTAYIGTLGQAARARREYGGLMSKPWRMVVVHLGAWGAFAALKFAAGRIEYGGLRVLDWACVVVIVGCVQTMALRLACIFRQLNRLS